MTQVSGADELLADIDGFLKRYPHSPARRVLDACRTHIAANAALAARCGELELALQDVWQLMDTARATLNRVRPLASQAEGER
jgi:hypothetical protein